MASASRAGQSTGVRSATAVATSRSGSEFSAKVPYRDSKRPEPASWHKLFLIWDFLDRRFQSPPNRGLLSRALFAAATFLRVIQVEIN